MIFTYKKWMRFCKNMHENNLHSIPAKSIENANGKYIVLKHDVETNVKNAFKMAKIEHSYNHHGVYYVQAYLLKDDNNIKMLQEMQLMGHEISYHYDVMDSCKGDLDKAIVEFDNNIKSFEEN